MEQTIATLLNLGEFEFLLSIGGDKRWRQLELVKKQYSGDFKSGRIRISNGQKMSVCKWSGFQIGIEIWKPHHLISAQMAAILSKTI